MKTKFSNLAHRLLIAVISLLGFTISSCQPLDMYGTPIDDYHSDFQVDNPTTEDAELASTPDEDISEEE
ncbi:MAG: hypothetical protein IKU22_07465 [Alistipes sp.]|nr:hypothetical protein [Alistipes sp.]